MTVFDLVTPLSREKREGAIPVRCSPLTTPAMIHVLIAHRHPLFCAGLRSILGQQEGIQIVGEAVERESLLDLVESTQPNVVLFDGALTSCQPVSSAIRMVALMRSAGARGIMVFAPSPNEEDLFHFLVSGAAAYEQPTLSGGDLVERIRRVAAGEYLISCVDFRSALKPVRKKAAEEAPVVVCLQQDRASPYPTTLTTREIIVLKQLLNGRSNKQIAGDLKLSSQTIKNHVKNILKKFQVSDRTLAVTYGLRQKVISLDDVDPSVLVLEPEAFVLRTQSYNHRPVHAAASDKGE